MSMATPARSISARTRCRSAAASVMSPPYLVRADAVRSRAVDRIRKDEQRLARAPSLLGCALSAARGFARHFRALLPGLAETDGDRLLRLFTLRPEPLLSVPFFRRRIVDFTFFAADLPYFAIVPP